MRVFAFAVVLALCVVCAAAVPVERAPRDARDTSSSAHDEAAFFDFLGAMGEHGSDAGAFVDVLEMMRDYAPDEEFQLEPEDRLTMEEALQAAVSRVHDSLSGTSADAADAMLLEMQSQAVESLRTQVSTATKSEVDALLHGDDSLFTKHVTRPACEAIYRGTAGGEDVDAMAHALLSEAILEIQKLFNKMIDWVAEGIVDMIFKMIPKFAQFMCDTYNEIRADMNFDVNTCDLVDCDKTEVFCLEPSKKFTCKLREFCIPVGWETKWGWPPIDVKKCIDFDQRRHFDIGKFLPRCPWRLTGEPPKSARKVASVVAKFVKTAFFIRSEIFKWKTHMQLWIITKFTGLSSCVGAIIKNACVNNFPPPSYKNYLGSCTETLGIGKFRFQAAGRNVILTVLEEVLTSKLLWKKVTKLIPIVDIIIDILEDVTQFVDGATCLRGLEAHGPEIIADMVKVRNGLINKPPVVDLIKMESENFQKRLQEHLKE